MDLPGVGRATATDCFRNFIACFRANLALDIATSIGTIAG